MWAAPTQHRFLGTEREAAPLRGAATNGRGPGRQRRRFVDWRDGKAAIRKAAKSNGRPAGKAREVFDRVSKLPRRQQEHIVNWVSAYVSQHEQTSRASYFLNSNHTHPSVALIALTEMAVTPRTAIFSPQGP